VSSAWRPPMASWTKLKPSMTKAALRLTRIQGTLSRASVGKKEDLGARASLNMRAIVAKRVPADNRHATKSGCGRPNGGCTCRNRCTGDRENRGSAARVVTSEVGAAR
jgi:hypothetical protein